MTNLEILTTLHLEEIKDMLKKFDLDIKVTHVNSMYCDSESMHFFGILNGQHYSFSFFANEGAVYTKYKVPGVGSMRQDNIIYNRGFMESWGNMVYVGECS